MPLFTKDLLSNAISVQKYLWAVEWSLLECVKNKKMVKDCILISTDPLLWKDMMDGGTGVLWTQQALAGLKSRSPQQDQSLSSQLSEATILLMISLKGS